MTVSEQLKAAIKASEETHYRIAKGTGVDTRTLDRFMEGTRSHIRSDTIDLLCEYLGLELCPKKQRTKKGKRAGKQAGKK